MVNKRISDMTELAEAPANGDLLPLVDVSDTTDDATGTNKKIQYSNLISGLSTASGTETLTNKTINTASNTITVNSADVSDLASSTVTFTNKTIDANGTGNSITNIDVADLATGTDGELITWDASGNPATVSVGTSGQVLTSNGAGAAPTFQAAGGGDMVLLASGTAASSTTTTFSFTGLSSSYKSYVITGNLTPLNASNQNTISATINNDTGTNYEFITQRNNTTSYLATQRTGQTYFPIYGETNLLDGETCSFTCRIMQDSTIGDKGFHVVSGAGQKGELITGQHADADALTRVDIFYDSSAVFKDGSHVEIYGVA